MVIIAVELTCLKGDIVKVIKAYLKQNKESVVIVKVNVCYKSFWKYM